MNILQSFLDEQNKTFDLSKLVSKELEDSDNALPPSFVYKYLPSDRKQFFVRPSFRFTQRSGLNDPFEITKRWDEFGGASTRQLFTAHLKTTFGELAKRKDIIVQLLKQQALARGTFLSDEQLRELRRSLSSKEGKRQVRTTFAQVEAAIDGFVEIAFGGANNGVDRFLAELGANHGIFSVSDTPANLLLWAYYAASGKGFVVELNVSNTFFSARNGRCLLRPVIYTDDRLPELFQNPLYMFLAKDLKWSFEREWRMLRKLSECDEVVGPNGDIHLFHVKPGLIRSVIFGYAYPSDEIATDAARILSYDPSVKIRISSIDNNSRSIVFHDLN